MTTIIPNPQQQEGEVPAKTRRLLITIDGPAGVGKSTSAKRLADRLGYSYLDTGALYRAVAWKVQTAKVESSSHEAIEALLSNTTIQLTSHNRILSVFVDSQEVSSELRSLAISQLASSVAAIPSVREWLLPIQRAFGAHGGIVAEGRDMGTRVFPGADVKFFLDADLDIRTSRRHHELPKGEQEKNWKEIRQSIADRDARDRSRDIAPLVQAPDSTLIDTSSLSVDEVIDTMMDVITKRL